MSRRRPGRAGEKQDSGGNNAKRRSGGIAEKHNADAVAEKHNAGAVAEKRHSGRNSENHASGMSAVRESGSYGALAGSYDALMPDARYPERAAFLTEHFLRRDVHTVLDLGCGTGTIAWLLSRQGFRVIAIDASSDMLTQAMGKAAAYPGFSPPLFVCQPMHRLDLGGHTVDAAISTLDALNYLLKESELREAFRRVYRFLRPGGQFWFDLNTPHKLQRMNRQLYMDESSDMFCVWRTFFSRKTKLCTYQVDLFRKRPDGAWDRRFEEHRERAWQEEEIRHYLQDAGFVNVKLYADLSDQPPGPKDGRWLICAEKPESA